MLMAFISLAMSPAGENPKDSACDHCLFNIDVVLIVMPLNKA